MEDLKIYKKAIELVKRVYTLIRDNQKLARDFSMTDQLKRAAVSAATNIAEGYFRSRKQTRNYLEIASGSTNEVVTLLKIVNEVFSINTVELQKEFIVLGKQINAYSNSF